MTQDSELEHELNTILGNKDHNSSRDHANEKLGRNYHTFNSKSMADIDKFIEKQ